ncbi:MAG: hypothetical protein RIS47_291 [Bacteroidota bacterium]
MKHLVLIVWVVVLLFSCNKPDNEVIVKPYNASQKLLSAVAWYQKSAEMYVSYRQSFEFASLKLQRNLSERTSALPPAVILDIDETVLDNSPFEVRCLQTQTAFSQDLWTDWVQQKKANALPGALEFIRYAQAKKVAVFLISNRDQSALRETIRNLQLAGFYGFTKDNVLLKTSGSDKTTRRDLVAKNYDVVLLVGDNLTDFSELYRDRTTNFGMATVDSTWKTISRNFIQLPNPMYGDWAKGFPTAKDATDAATDSVILSKLTGY